MSDAKGTRQAGSFFQTDKDMVKSDVYRSLHLASRAILVELQAMHSGVRNNGWIMLGVLEAGRRIGIANKTTIGAAFHELEDKGFIVRTWEPDGDKSLIRKGYASTWLLTFHDAEIAGRKIPASNAWTKWSGKAVKPPKLPDIYPPDRAEQYGKTPLPVEPKKSADPSPRKPPKVSLHPKPEPIHPRAAVAPRPRRAETTQRVPDTPVQMPAHARAIAGFMRPRSYPPGESPF